MRLTKLKLAGFKSFVDPTTVLFPSQLAGVVGPNGCGKSNIIDAVRWVLGESKASELRGESIQDVIFKGSGTRKEVSRASVELYFDNAQGKAAGQWSQYEEITVKRVLDREGNSSYYINNLHVRRRDVIDLFLGTGLGPRAYAIIGQGMISRIVEAKPDDLRGFLEEAAGVTKYKERRKETENRLEDARENLSRVEDIRNELDGQIGRLESQAEVARQYKDLNAQLTRKQQLLWLKKRNDARQDAARLATTVAESATRLEGETAQLREIEARVEHAREAHFAASDALHNAQAEMYAANAEVTRLETEIGRMRETTLRLEQRLQQLSVEDGHWRGQAAQLQQDAARWNSLLENARLRAGTAGARHEEAAERLPQAEEAVQAAGSALSEARMLLAEAEQGLRLAEADRGHADRALEGLGQRAARLEQEKAALGAPDPIQLAASQEAQARAEEELAMQQERLAELQGRLPGFEAQLRSARERLQAAHRQATESRARRDALVQLQKRVQQSGDIGEWLQARGLADAKPLWQSLQVEPGWETAVEAVLRERLAALVTDGETARQALASPPPTIVALALPDGAPALPLAAEGLRAKVRSDDSRWSSVLDEWLGQVMVAEDLNVLPTQASPFIQFVNRAGHLRGAHGLTLYVPDAKTHGVIERQREIEELEAVIEARQQDEDAARESQQEAERQLADTQAELAQTRRGEQESRQRAHAAQVEALKLAQAQARFEERAAQITRDLEDIRRHEDTERTAQMRAEEGAARWGEQLEVAQERLARAGEVQRQKENALREARALEQQLSREAQEAGFSERECISKLEDNARNVEIAQTQLERVVGETVQAREELAGISDDVLLDQLQAALINKQSQEGLLAERRNGMETVAAELRAMDEQRLRLEQGLTPLRDKINELKLKQQAAQLNEEQYQQRLVEANADEGALIPDLLPGLRESTMQGEITRLGNEIEALGPVNLAALEELNSARERKGYLDAQSGDLLEAINTLDDAIRRIDRETREQLQETYDTVNRHFGTLFPQLFGGGEARLILTGDEILDAGIQIMAQPPGKKNSTIHLLSGGEKALTAIALVFAMFQLNPAPFCLLDEVDAPLDDSNTARFADMVKRMSVSTQFIFISHNKIAMEMAQQLIGVTMQERGVSRVVEVDMEEALRMTEEKAA
ncbi:chromosome segregation protein SMC [Denitratisoma oestradiolicum]|uniref:Chromosome partition protein Smc n=1 Tax=Denitratisoma oestradiolicum TaxID=311182 RepID=A0A6S6XTR7_9PROT|nr:chromosome segregation protein SMC [Denitratisoma oestradiolicum]TWO79077.1 chromosome segregation protein SMC [Denitratisoma oestradiolicum]CAB1368170.1 Chromosome partition protein Smc [Denitratisoma oestradiolicum]